MLNVQLPPVLAKINQIGGAGIYIFLFASSYGLFFSKSNSWTEFYLKRFKKVLVPYYIGITFIFVINYFFTLYPDGWQAYLSHFFLYKMFYEPYMESFGTHFWFISTIVQFYLIWPLLLAVAQRLSTKKLVIIAFFISILYSLLIFKLGVQKDRIWCSSVIQYLWVLILGLAAAKEKWFPKLLQLGLLWYGIAIGFGLIIVLMISCFMGSKGNIFNDYFMFLIYLCSCILFFRLGQKIQNIIRFILWIEYLSYSLYIIHLFIFEVYLKALSKTQIQLYEVSIVLSICLISAMGYERIMNWIMNINSGNSRSIAKA